MVLLESLKIKHGSPAPDFRLKGVDELEHALADYKNAKILVIVFMCNHCPYVHATWPRLNALQAKYKDQSVRFVGINPNLNPEYPEETFEKMKEYAHKFGMQFPYLQDESQQVAKAYQACCTPDIFVYDVQRTLVYHGRVDDNWQEPQRVKNHELDEAIATLLKGQPLTGTEHPSMGCSIKWR